MRKLFIFFIFVIMAAVGLFYFRMIQSANGYELTSPKKGTAVQAVYATGEVEPLYWSEISPQISGKISEIYVKEGDKVKTGQSLAKLEDDLECAKASEIMARLQFLDKEVTRYAELSLKDHVSRQSYEKVLSERNSVKAQLETQNALVARMLMTSPLDGTVLRRDIEPGEAAKTDQVIFWVGQLKPLRISAEVDEEDIPLVKSGQKSLIKADAFINKNVIGEVSEITPKGDPVNKNFRVRISLPDDSPLLIGMTVEVNIVTKEEPDSLLIPSSCVIGKKVWVSENGEISERIIKTGIRSEYLIQVLDGLRENEKILAKPEEYISRHR